MQRSGRPHISLRMTERPEPVAHIRRRGHATRFLGDTPGRVLVKLLVLSLFVGMAMRFFGWSPQDVYWALRDAAADAWAMGFGALDDAFGYILLGAAVVVPVFLVIRLLSFRR